MKRYFFCGKCKRKKEIKNVIIKAALNTILCFFFFFFFLIIYICAVFKEFFKNKLSYKNRKQRIKFVQTFKGKMFSCGSLLVFSHPTSP